MTKHLQLSKDFYKYCLIPVFRLENRIAQSESERCPNKPGHGWGASRQVFSPTVSIGDFMEALSFLLEVTMLVHGNVSVGCVLQASHNMLSFHPEFVHLWA